MHLAGVTVGWEPLGKRIRFDERAIDPFGRGTKYAVELDAA